MLSLLHVIDNPEDIDNPARSLPYNAMQWNGHRIIEYVPSKPHNASIHIDPEFVTYTYGSPELTWSEKRGKMVPEKNCMIANGIIINVIVSVISLNGVANSVPSTLKRGSIALPPKGPMNAVAYAINSFFNSTLTTHIRRNNSFLRTFYLYYNLYLFYLFHFCYT